jgi:Protein of unknown function (DUF3592)
MYTTEKLLKMITSHKASVRYDACEWIRVRQESSPELVRALERATYDEDIDVAERAKYALQADVHHQLAIELGIIKPDDPVTKRKLPAPVTSTGESRDSPWAAGFLGISHLILGLSLFINAISTQWLIKSRKSWPVTKGEVISATTELIHYEDGDETVPVITYRYAVSGDEYSCEIRANDRSTRWDTYAKLPVGSHVNVYYDPGHPEVCLSEFDTVRSADPWVGLLFIASGSFFIWVLIQGLRK